MKKKLLIRFVMIGALHTFLYLWLVPFIIYPRFGHDGFMFTVAIAVVISVSLLGMLFLGKKNKQNMNPDIASNNDSEKHDEAGDIYL